MREMVKEQFLQDIADLEKLYLISVEGNDIVLCYDIECRVVFESQVETMCFIVY